MAGKILHSAAAEVWKLVRAQHGVIARRQLLALGYSSAQIDQRIKTGRLHRVFAGVYAVGRPDLIAVRLTALPLTHSQIKYEPGYVTAMLATTARRLRAEQVGRELEQVRNG